MFCGSQPYNFIRFDNRDVEKNEWKGAAKKTILVKNALKISNDANPIFFRHEFYANLFYIDAENVFDLQNLL